MVAAATFFGAMAFAAKIASARLSGPEVAMIRMVIGLLPCLLIPRYRRAAMHFKRLDLILYRGIFGGRHVIFMNPLDIRDLNLRDGQWVDLTSHFEGEQRHA